MADLCFVLDKILHISARLTLESNSSSPGGFDVTSLPTKVRVFSEVSRRRKTEVSYFTPQFLKNY